MERSPEELAEMEKQRINDPEKAEHIAREVDGAYETVNYWRREVEMFRSLGISSRAAYGAESELKRTEGLGERRTEIETEKYDLGQIKDRDSLLERIGGLENRLSQAQRELDTLESVEDGDVPMERFDEFRTLKERKNSEVYALKELLEFAESRTKSRRKNK